MSLANAALELYAPKLRSSTLLAAAVAVLGACTTPEERHGHSCQQYGFPAGSAEYLQCVRHLEAMRKHFGELESR